MFHHGDDTETSDMGNATRLAEKSSRRGRRGKAELVIQVEITPLSHHRTGASNGPTDGLNLLVKKVKRCGHGSKSFDNCRLRVLLHTGGVTWPTRQKPPRIRMGSPKSNA